MRWKIWLYGVGTTSAVAAQVAAPLVIAHRGNSGIYPEATYSAYESAARTADYLECDVILSADHVVYCTHEPHLSELTTNIMHDEYRGKFPMEEYRSDAIERIRGTNPNVVAGWFAAEFRKTDLNALRVKHRFTGKDSKLSGADPLLKLEDLLKIAMETGKGLYLETKYSDWHYARYGMDLNKVVLDTICDVTGGCELLHVPVHELENDKFVPTIQEQMAYDSVIHRIHSEYHQTRLQVVPNVSGLPIPVILQSFQYEDLLYWHLTGWTTNLDAGSCALLYDANEGDSKYGDILYRDTEDPQASETDLLAMNIEDARLHAVGVKYLGIDKRILLDEENYGGIVKEAHLNGFEVHAWTFSIDQSSTTVTSYDFSGVDEEGIIVAAEVSPARLVDVERHIDSRFQGDYKLELRYFMELGVDGFFTDYPAFLREYLAQDTVTCGSVRGLGMALLLPTSMVLV